MVRINLETPQGIVDTNNTGIVTQDLNQAGMVWDAVGRTAGQVGNVATQIFERRVKVRDTEYLTDTNTRLTELRNTWENSQEKLGLKNSQDRATRDRYQADYEAALTKFRTEAIAKAPSSNMEREIDNRIGTITLGARLELQAQMDKINGIYAIKKIDDEAVTEANTAFHTDDSRKVESQMAVVESEYQKLLETGVISPEDFIKSVEAAHKQIRFGYMNGQFQRGGLSGLLDMTLRGLAGTEKNATIKQYNEEVLLRKLFIEDKDGVYKNFWGNATPEEKNKFYEQAKTALISRNSAMEKEAKEGGEDYKNAVEGLQVGYWDAATNDKMFQAELDNIRTAPFKDERERAKAITKVTAAHAISNHLGRLLYNSNIPELDEKGNYKKDEKGNFVFKTKKDKEGNTLLDETGNPIYEEQAIFTSLDEINELGKLSIKADIAQFFTENPVGILEGVSVESATADALDEFSKLMSKEIEDMGTLAGVNRYIEKMIDSPNSTVPPALREAYMALKSDNLTAREREKYLDTYNYYVTGVQKSNQIAPHLRSTVPTYIVERLKGMSSKHGLVAGKTEVNTPTKINMDLGLLEAIEQQYPPKYFYGIVQNLGLESGLTAAFSTSTPDLRRRAVKAFHNLEENEKALSAKFGTKVNGVSVYETKVDEVKSFIKGTKAGFLDFDNKSSASYWELQSNQNLGDKEFQRDQVKAEQTMLLNMAIEDWVNNGRDETYAGEGTINKLMQEYLSTKDIISAEDDDYTFGTTFSKQSAYNVTGKGNTGIKPNLKRWVKAVPRDDYEKSTIFIKAVAEQLGGELDLSKEGVNGQSYKNALSSQLRLSYVEAEDVIELRSYDTVNNTLNPLYMVNREGKREPLRVSPEFFADRNIGEFNKKIQERLVNHVSWRDKVMSGTVAGIGASLGPIGGLAAIGIHKYADTAKRKNLKDAIFRVPQPESINIEEKE